MGRVRKAQLAPPARRVARTVRSAVPSARFVREISCRREAPSCKVAQSPWQIAMQSQGAGGEGGLRGIEPDALAPRPAPR
jgi:hypothetical protein